MHGGQPGVQNPSATTPGQTRHTHGAAPTNPAFKPGPHRDPNAAMAQPNPAFKTRAIPGDPNAAMAQPNPAFKTRAIPGSRTPRWRTLHGVRN